MFSRFKKFIAALLCVLVSAEAALLPAAEGNFWSERRRAGAVGRGIEMASLPESFRSDAAALLSGPASFAVAPLDPLAPASWTTGPDGLSGPLSEIAASIPAACGAVRKVSSPPAAPFRSSSTSRTSTGTPRPKRTSRRRSVAWRPPRRAADPELPWWPWRARFDPLPSRRYQEFPDKTVTRNVSDYLLREQKISGPVYALLTGDGPQPSAVEEWT